MEQERLITSTDLARMLNVHPRTIRRMVERKEIQALHVGRQWRFRREWIDEWFESNTVNGEARDSA